MAAGEKDGDEIYGFYGIIGLTGTWKDKPNATKVNNYRIETNKILPTKKIKTFPI